MRRTGFEVELVVGRWVKIFIEFQDIHVSPCYSVHNGIWH